MYPLWLTNLFQDNRCPECRGALTLDDIIAIGARRPEPFEAHLREPLALILATCRHCGISTNFSTRCPRDGLIDAVNELADQIESAPAGEPPLIRPSAEPSTPQSRPPADATRSNRGRVAVRPSVREGQASDPPTEKEIKAFLARLKRMSFKPGSKGFNKLSGSD